MHALSAPIPERAAMPVAGLDASASSMVSQGEAQDVAVEVDEQVESEPT